MADDVTLNPGFGGAVVHTDEIAGVHHPVSKLELGGDGVDGGFVTDTNPLPVIDGDSGQRDAFGRKRMSMAHAESEISFQYDLNPLYVETIVTGGATVSHDVNSRTAILALSTGGPTAGTGTVEIPLGSGNPKTATFSASQTFAAGDVFEVAGTPYYVLGGATGFTHAVNGTSTCAAGSSFTRWGSRAVLRQKQRNLYQKGMSQLIKETFVLPAAVEGMCVQAGYYAHHNGYYARRKKTGGVTTVSFTERSFTTGALVETEVEAYNLAGGSVGGEAGRIICFSVDSEDGAPCAPSRGQREARRHRSGHRDQGVGCAAWAAANGGKSSTRSRRSSRATSTGSRGSRARTWPRRCAPSTSRPPRARARAGWRRPPTPRPRLGRCAR